MTGLIVNDFDPMEAGVERKLSELYPLSHPGGAMILEHDRAFPTKLRLVLYTAGSADLFLLGLGSMIAYVWIDPKIWAR